MTASNTGAPRNWHLGEVCVLRHAGFPFDWLEELGFSPEQLARIDAVLAAEDGLREELRAKKGGDKAGEAVAKLDEALAAGQVPQLPKDPGLQQKLLALARAREEASVAYAQGRTELRPRLHQRACDPKVQEAVFLSSPDMFENVWSRYVSQAPGPESSDARRVERQVYSYIQRFCAKNETASFFGPMGYGELDEESKDHSKDLAVEILPQTRRRVFLSFQFVRELVAAITADKQVWMVLPMRKNPVFRIEGNAKPAFAVCVSAERTVPLEPQHLEILRLLETTDTLEGLAEALKLEVRGALMAVMPLLRGGVVVRELRYRPHSLEAFRSVVEALQSLPQNEGTARWLEGLGKLEGLRAQFEAADLAGRRALLPKLEAAFTELTGKEARRGQGQMYSDRLVVYEEASSPFRLRWSRAFAEKLGAQLSASLDLSEAYGSRYQRETWKEISKRAKGGPRTMELLQYAAKFAPQEQGAGSQRFALLDPVMIPPSSAPEQQVDRSAAGEVGEGGRYALPDVCLEQRPDGSYDVLLARVHHHLLLWSWLAAFHTGKEKFERSARRFVEREPTARGLWEMAFSRRNKGFYDYPGTRVLYTAMDPRVPGEKTVDGAQLEVDLSGPVPKLIGPDGERKFLYLPLADFATYLPYAALAHPLVLHAPLRSEGGHTPRIRIGEAIYQRERWELPTLSLEKPRGLDAFLAIRRQVRKLRWPRFLFARVKSERKPILVDTQSPFSIELLKHLAHDDPASFEEMYPTPEGLWLRDERGRYTFELRMEAERWTVEP